MKYGKFVVAAVLALSMSGLRGVRADDPAEILGVIGMSPVGAHSYAAIWLPVEEGKAITGIRWYNSDNTVVFPQVLLVAGDAEYPASRDNATEAGHGVQGGELAWSEFLFSEPYVCPGGGIYCLLQFPQGSDYQAPGTGGGAAVGYTSTQESRTGWLGGEENGWTRLSGDSGVAMDPIVVDSAPGMVQLSRSIPIAKYSTALTGASPNPFNPSTSIAFVLAEKSFVNIDVYDVRGRHVYCLDEGIREAGQHQVAWNGVNDRQERVASGVYLVQMKVGEARYRAEVVLLK